MPWWHGDGTFVGGVNYTDQEGDAAIRDRQGHGVGQANDKSQTYGLANPAFDAEGDRRGQQ